MIDRFIHPLTHTLIQVSSQPYPFRKPLNLESLEPENDMLRTNANDQSNIQCTETLENDKVDTNTTQTTSETTVGVNTLIEKYQMMNELMYGKVFRHFKGHVYKIIGLSIDFESLEVIASYQRIDGNGDDRQIIWSRPASMFFENVKNQDGTECLRFEEV